MYAAPSPCQNAWLIMIFFPIAGLMASFMRLCST